LTSTESEELAGVASEEEFTDSVESSGPAVFEEESEEQATASKAKKASATNPFFIDMLLCFF
jgi:hypothetical protein